jgi:hypothetical protein
MIAVFFFDFLAFVMKSRYRLPDDETICAELRSSFGENTPETAFSQEPR